MLRARRRSDRHRAPECRTSRSSPSRCARRPRRRCSSSTGRRSTGQAPQRRGSGVPATVSTRRSRSLIAEDLADQRVCLTEVVILGVQGVSGARMSAPSASQPLSHRALRVVLVARGPYELACRPGASPGVVVLHRALIVIGVASRRSAGSPAAGCSSCRCGDAARPGRRTREPQHLVGGDAGAWYLVFAGREGCLLDLGEVVRRVLVQREACRPCAAGSPSSTPIFVRSNGLNR